MRRMNYNPLEKPFASGEIYDDLSKFILDRELENGLYLIIAYCTLDDNSVTSLIYFEKDKYTSSSNSNSPGYDQPTAIFFSNGTTYNEIYINDAQLLGFDKGSTIKLYKLI